MSRIHGILALATGQHIPTQKMGQAALCRAHPFFFTSNIAATRLSRCNLEFLEQWRLLTFHIYSCNP